MTKKTISKAKKSKDIMKMKKLSKLKYSKLKMQYLLYCWLFNFFAGIYNNRLSKKIFNDNALGMVYCYARLYQGKISIINPITILAEALKDLGLSNPD